MCDLNYLVFAHDCLQEGISFYLVPKRENLLHASVWFTHRSSTDEQADINPVKNITQAGVDPSFSVQQTDVISRVLINKKDIMTI
jgi:hypothetical protein